MRCLKKIVVFVLMFFAFFSEVKANHLLGGEITWKRVSNSSAGNPRYVFYMKVYRDCYGGGASFDDLEDLMVKNYGYRKRILMERISFVDVTPNCGAFKPPFQALFVGERIEPCNMENEMEVTGEGSVTENAYRSQDTIELIGTPPAEGWIFYFDDSRDRTINPMRNEVNNIVNNTNNTFAVRSVMYQNDADKEDSSPVFLERPLSVFPTQVEFQYNPNAYDEELDSLVYDWASLKDDQLRDIRNYVAGFSYNQPFPGVGMDPDNIPVEMDAVTGAITLRSDNIGSYAFCIKVTAYDKCSGVKKAEVFRDMQVRFLEAFRAENEAPVISLRQGGVTTPVSSLEYEVIAGESVDLNLSVSNKEPLYTMGGIDCGFQSIRFVSSSGQYGAGLMEENQGCDNPPCATLQPYYDDFVEQRDIYPKFHWQTSCDHVQGEGECGDQTNVYNFILMAEDNACPASAKNIVTMTIKVFPKPYTPSPEVLCLSQASANSLKIEWEAVKDTLETFDSYVVFHANDLEGPYQEVAAISDITTLSYEHQAIDLSEQHYFYVITRSGCYAGHESVPLDTLQMVGVSLTGSEGDVALAWNPMRLEGDDVTEGDYEVYRKKGEGSWELIRVQDELTMDDYVFSCASSFVKYKAVWKESGCESAFLVDSDEVEDAIPQSTEITYVTVDTASGNVIVNWEESKDRDAKAYVVYYPKETNFPVDTIVGKENVSFVDESTDASSEIYNYVVAVVDSCDKIGLISEQIHNTVLLNLNQRICTNENILSWNEYKNMHPAVESYKVYASENGGDYLLLADLPSGSVSYVHKDIDTEEVYCYLIEATNGAYVSHSNTVCSNSIAGEDPYCYLRKASVSENGVDLAWYADSLLSVDYIELNRRKGNGDWEVVFTLAAPTKGLFFYTDNKGLETTKYSYSYQLVLGNQCGQELLRSNLGKTILLKGSADNNAINSLDWTYYKEWQDGVQEYLIYREDAFGQWELIDQLSWSENTYQDYVRDLSFQSGSFCYLVQAVEENIDFRSFKDTASSNRICVTQSPDMILPNAIAPTRKNNMVFKPIPIFVNEEGYSMQIFNRWGQKLFETRKLEEGWDGTYEGKKQPAGVYVYLIRYLNEKGEELVEKGTVTLVW